MLAQSARLCLDFIQSVARNAHSTPFPQPEKAKEALSRLQSLLSTLELDDAKAMGELRVCAHQVFDSLGIPLPE
jgi:RecB family exonuclease